MPAPPALMKGFSGCQAVSQLSRFAFSPLPLL